MNEGPWQAHVVRILVIEDDPADQELLQLAIERNDVSAELISCFTGRSALETLEAGPLPDLVLLDLHLPDMDGISVLKEIKQHEVWAPLPVIILSGSSDRDDVERGYAHHAAAYLQKPGTQQGWQKLVRTFTDYWLTVVLLPKS